MFMCKMVAPLFYLEEGLKKYQSERMRCREAPRGSPGQEQ